MAMSQMICHVIISAAVLISLCCAVEVTVVTPSPVPEGTETDLICSYERSKDGSVLAPIITWSYTLQNGNKDLIVSQQSGVGDVQEAYMVRFSIDGSTLTIIDTQLADAGEYTCTIQIIDDDQPIQDKSLTLVVIYFNEPVSISFDGPAIETSEVVMTCTVDSDPAPTYTFYFNSDIVQQGMQSTLTFSSVDQEKDGMYTCHASNGAGSAISVGKQLDVYYAPVITRLGDIEVGVGETAYVNFPVDAKPLANYAWSTAPETTDLDNDPMSYTFTVSSDTDVSYAVTLNASNEVGASQMLVNVNVVDSCGTLDIQVESPQTTIVNGEINVKEDENVILACNCDSSSGSGAQFEHEWILDGEEISSNKLDFKSKSSGHNVTCVGTRGAPSPNEKHLRVYVSIAAGTSSPLSTGAIVGMVIGIIVVLVILAIVIVIVMKSREDGPAAKSADSAYMDVTWNTKDPNRINQAKKTAPPSNGDTKPQEAAKQDPYDSLKYDQYDGEKAYAEPSYGYDEYNDRQPDDDYVNSMPVTV